MDRDRLLDMVQGREAHLFDRAVDNQISRLRRKMEADNRDPKLIQTVWGGGYMLAAEVKRFCRRLIDGPAMRRFLPKSLQGQMLLSVALGLLVAQVLSAFLLFRAEEQRHEARLINSLAFQLVRDPAGQPARWAAGAGTPRTTPPDTDRTRAGIPCHSRRIEIQNAKLRCAACLRNRASPSANWW